MSQQQQTQYNSNQQQYNQHQYNQQQNSQNQQQYSQQQYSQQHNNQQYAPQQTPQTDYSKHQYAAQQNQSNQQQHDLVPKKEDRFKGTEYKDLWATILWVIFLLGFAGISAYSIKNGSSAAANSTQPTNNGPNSGNNINFKLQDADIGILVAATAITGLGLSIVYFLAMQRFAGTLIKVTLIAAVIFNFAIAFLFFVLKQWIMGIFMLIMAALYALCYWSWRHRIPFAKVMLKAVTSITQRYPALIYIGIWGLLVQFAYVAWFLVTIIAFSNTSRSQNISSGANYAIGVYILFTFYWTTQIISNAVHITVAGVFATFYFRGVADSNGNVDVPVKNPTVSSLKRALTTSLGPNCYGSLLIAIIQTLKALADQARHQDGNSENMACAIVLCCISCILGLVQDLLEYFNKYAFAQVAIYGKDYCTAAKDTWALAKARGIDALINDNLIGNVLGMGGLLIGLITAGVGLIAVKVSPTIPDEPVYFIVVGICGLFIGMVEFSVLANVIDSGVTTTFVCLAEDPQALAQTKPQLYREIQRVYPQVVMGV